MWRTLTQNLKIDKVTVWDSGSNGNGGAGATSGFLRSLIGSLPPMHELAAQAGLDLPGILGTVQSDRPAKTAPRPQSPPTEEPPAS